MFEYLFPGFILSTLFNCLFILMIANSKIKIILKIFWSIVLIIFFTIIFACMFNLENKQWNNGYCLRCGTPYQAISYSHGSTRYECPKCHYAFSR